MKASQFAYHRPTTPEEAVGLLAELGDDAKLLAGGQSLIPMLALRLTAFAHLIDIGRVSALRGIEVVDGVVRIGATTTQAAIERSPDVEDAAPLLARATRFIGHFQIRNRGTIGGSLAHADPAAEYPAVSVALDAEFEVLGPNGRRTIPAGEFFTDLWTTAVGEDELLTSVAFPTWSGRRGFAVREFARRTGDFAIAGAAVAVELDGDDRVRRCGIGLLGLSSTPRRADAAEAAITGALVDELSAIDLGRLAIADLTGIPSDLHGSASYRRRVGARVVADAWTAAIEEARRG